MKKHGSLLFYLFFVVLLSGCVVQFTRRPATDAYAVAQKKGYTFYPFSISNVPLVPDSNSDTIRFYEINSVQMKQLLSRCNAAWVNYWASWCPHCSIELPFAINFAREHRITYIPLATDYNIPLLMKDLWQAGYRGPAFIISNREYGENETGKYIRFNKELTGLTDSAAAFPTHVFFSHGKMTGMHRGELSRENEALIPLNGWK